MSELDMELKNILTQHAINTPEINLNYDLEVLLKKLINKKIP
jgi:hypothetical protein